MNRTHSKQTIRRDTGRESISAHQAIAQERKRNGASFNPIGEPNSNRDKALIELALIGLYCLVLICIYITPKVNGSLLEQSVAVPKDARNCSYSLSAGGVYEYA